MQIYSEDPFNCFWTLKFNHTLSLQTGGETNLYLQRNLMGSQNITTYEHHQIVGSLMERTHSNSLDASKTGFLFIQLLKSGL